MERRIFLVNYINCHNVGEKLLGAIRELPGVTEASFFWGARRYDVAYDETVFSEGQLREVIAKHGGRLYRILTADLPYTVLSVCSPADWAAPLA